MAFSCAPLSKRDSDLFLQRLIPLPSGIRHPIPIGHPAQSVGKKMEAIMTELLWWEFCVKHWSFSGLGLLFARRFESNWELRPHTSRVIMTLPSFQTRNPRKLLLFNAEPHPHEIQIWTNLQMSADCTTFTMSLTSMPCSSLFHFSILNLCFPGWDGLIPWRLQRLFQIWKLSQKWR